MSLEPTLTELFRAAAEKMRAEFAEVAKASPHAGERGEEAEEILRQFLNERLPKRYAAASGHMIDSQNRISHQTDVLIYDQISSPVYRVGKGLILPSENVAAVIEVKSRLTKAELADGVKKIAKAKSLYRPPLGPLDQPVTFSSLVTTSLFGVVFAFSSETKLETLGENLRDLHNDLPSTQWTDMVVVLDEGIVAFYVQFPFDKGHMAGMFMPPASPTHKVPAVYVHLMVQRQGLFTLHRFFVAMSSQLVFFRRVTTVPIEQIMGQAPKEGFTIQGYWCGTDHRFAAVPPDQEVGQHPGLVEQAEILDAAGRAVGRVGWMRWADGHIIVFLGPGDRPPNEIAQCYLPKREGVLITPGGKDRRDVWVSEVLPGLPDYFAGRTLALPELSGGKFSGRLVR
jgi:hypothetical protein